MEINPEVGEITLLVNIVTLLDRKLTLFFVVSDAEQGGYRTLAAELIDRLVNIQLPGKLLAS